MEVTTVSPSPASLTDGDDLCEIDVTNVVIHSFTLFFSFCGLLGNGAVLYLLRLKVCNTDIYGLALCDFVFMFFTVPSAVLFLKEDLSCFPIMPLLYLRFLFLLSVVSYCWVLLLVMVRRYINYMSKLCNLCCHSDLSMRLLLLLLVVLHMAPVIVFTFSPVVANLRLSHQQEHCRAALILIYIIIVFRFTAPTVIPTIINFIQAIKGSLEQQPRRRAIVVFLIVLFGLLLSFCNFLHQPGYAGVSSEVLFLLNCIHSSIKPFIYFLVGRCWSPCSLESLQLSLQRVFDEQEEETAHTNDASLETGV